MGIDTVRDIPIYKMGTRAKNEMVTKIVSALEIILHEEIDHVKKGDVWFAYACTLEGVEKNVYFEIIKKYYPRGFLRPQHLNVEARKEAGFSCNELQEMGNTRKCE